MLREWDRQFPQRLDSMFTAVQNVAPSQLADRELFDFVSLKAAPDNARDVPEGRLDLVNLSI
jgi:tRNA 2-thiocytidine biosynthesis protein TtcA